MTRAPDPAPPPPKRARFDGVPAPTETKADPRGPRESYKSEGGTFKIDVMAAAIEPCLRPAEGRPYWAGGARR